MAALYEVTSAAPVEETRLLQFKNEHKEDGYNFNFETSDGQKREEVGSIRYLGENEALLNVRGSYSFVGADGVEYLVNYVADENGFRPSGAHLPRNPVAANNRL